MKERKETINLVTANVVAVVIFLVSFVGLTILHIYLWRSNVQYKTTTIGGFIFLLVMVLGIVVHELIHGATWAYFSKQGWKSISFGVIWKMLTPYCHCSEPLIVKHYAIGCLMPLIVLGIIPAIIGMAINSLYFTWYGAIFISAAGGDIMVAWRLRREPSTNLILDHPTEAGYLVYEEE